MKCPACDAVIDADATVISVDGIVAATKCTNCGAALPNLPASDEPGETQGSRLTNEDTSEEEPTPTIIRDERSQLRRIAHFELVRVLGQGGFGAVWLATDTNLERPVALKLPKNHDAGLLREAQTAARLKHPNIVAVYEVGVNDGHAFIASEYIQGETLKDELIRGRPTIERAVSVMKRIASAAEHAHAHDVVHRDMKPANVMVNGDGEPFITDFGIAKSIATDETISNDGEIVGTIAYMAPEQARGDSRRTDRRADVYAMGVMLFELLTEYRPFRGTAQGILFQKDHQDAPSPRSLVPTLPRDIETICMKCLERDPDKRYQTARELAEELDRVQNNLPILARPISRMEKAWRWSCRNPRIAVLSVSLFLSLVAGLVGVTYFMNNAVISAERTRETLYRAHMNLAANSWANADAEGLIQQLDAYRKPDVESLRDFSWHYYEQAVSPIRAFVNHGTAIRDVAVSRDGNLIATIGTKDRALNVWDVASQKRIVDLANLPFQCLAVDFSPADDRLLTGDDDGVIRIWNPTVHDHVAFELQHGGVVTSAAFSPDRKFIASGSASGVVKVWQVASKKAVAEFSRPNQAVIDIVFSSDSGRVAVLFVAGTTPAARTKALIDVRHVPSCETIPETDPVRSLSGIQFDQTGQTLVATSNGGFLYRFSAQTGEELLRVPSSVARAIGGITRLSDSGAIIVVDSVHQMTMLDENLQRSHDLNTHTNTFGVIDASADGQWIVVGSGDGQATLVSAEDFSVPVVGWQPGIVRDIAFCDDNVRVAAACDDGAVRIWNAESGEFSTAVPADDMGRPMLAVDVFSDRIVGCGMMRDLLIGETSSDIPIERTRIGPGGHDVVRWSPTGEMIAVGSRQGEVSIYRATDLESPFTSFHSTGRVNALAFSTTAGKLVAAFADRRVVFVDLESQETEDVTFADDDSPKSLTFCNHDTILVVGTQQGFLHFIDLQQSTLIAKLKAHAGAVNDLCVIPDERQLVSAGQDRLLKIWDVSSRELITQLAGHDRGVVSVCVSPNGRHLASSGTAGDIRIWRSSGD